jgi:hypothetical protein
MFHVGDEVGNRTGLFVSPGLVGLEDTGGWVGPPVGYEVGLLVEGRTVGCPEGCKLGCMLGCEEGWPLGCAEGCVLGCVEGCTLGCLDGFDDG